MKQLTYLFISILIINCLACSKEKELTLQEAKQQIYDIEQAFNDMLAKEGRAKAFSHFAAENGGIQRNGQMIVGKDSIFAFYDEKTSINVKLTWKPDRIDISDDFTMASTWGKFEYSGTKQNGENFQSTGVFHTVWKRQSDGSWRYIYD